MAISFNSNIKGCAGAESLSAVFRISSPLELNFTEAKIGGERVRERYIEQFASLPEAQKLKETGFLGDVTYVHDHKKAKAIWDTHFGKNGGWLAMERFSGEHLSGSSLTIAETFPGLRPGFQGEIAAPQDVIVWPSFFTNGFIVNDRDVLATIGLHEFQHVEDLQTIERRMSTAGDSQGVMHAVAEIRAMHMSLTGVIRRRLPVSNEFLFEQARSYFSYLEDFEKLEKSDTARHAVASLPGLQVKRRWALDREPKGIRYMLVFDIGSGKMSIDLTAPTETEPGWSEVLRG